MIDKHLLLINLDSSPEAVELNVDDTATINLAMSSFDFALDRQEIYKFIDGFLDIEALQNIRHSPEFIELCKLIQLQECIAFLIVKLEEHQLYFSPGENSEHHQAMPRVIQRSADLQFYLACNSGCCRLLHAQ